MRRIHDQHGRAGLLAVLLLLIVGLLIARQWHLDRPDRVRATGSHASGSTPVGPAGPIESTRAREQPIAYEPVPATAPPTALPAATPAPLPLADIDRLIKQNKLPEARARLHALPADLRGDRTARTQASILWHNLALAQEREHATPAEVITAYKTALTLDPDNQRAYLNLVRTYWKTKDPALTDEMLTRATLLAPEDPVPHQILAQRLIERDDLASAVTHLEQAKSLPGLSPIALQWVHAQLAHVEQARRSEQRFQARESSHFTVKYDGGEDYAVWSRVLEILEEAYRDIGRQLGHYPGTPILVVLHTRERFHDATGGPAWSDGLYDSLLGRIKVPTQGALTDQVRLTQVLRHEYVHALLHDRLQGRRIPQWLNEGLAMQLGGDAPPDIPSVMPGSATLINLSYLEGPWGGLPTAAARLAYLEGSSATRYLIDRFGMSIVRDLLEEMAKGTSFPTAFKDRVFISYEQFQQRWVEQLNQGGQNGST